jgi:hypothetical protein
MLLRSGCRESLGRVRGVATSPSPVIMNDYEM